MASRRFLFGFGNPPFKFLAQYLAQDTDFQEDAQHILELNEDAYLRLATQLAKTDAFLSRSDLATIVGESLGEGELSDRIASIIFRIGGILHDAKNDPCDPILTECRELGDDVSIAQSVLDIVVIN